MSIIFLFNNITIVKFLHKILFPVLCNLLYHSRCAIALYTGVNGWAHIGELETVPDWEIFHWLNEETVSRSGDYLLLRHFILYYIILMSTFAVEH